MSKRLIVLVLMTVMAVALLPTGAALAATPAAPILEVKDCAIHVEFDAENTGPYEVWIWDDGVVVQSKTASGDPGDTLVFDFLVTSFGPVAPGVGLEVNQGGTALFYTEIPDITADCLASLAVGCTPSLTAGAVVGQITQTTVAHFAPSLDAATTTVLPAGQTWWVLGTDASGDWYKILVSCEDVWVPASALGPNFDAVWGGAALPGNALQ
jgi:hypothetical protein